MASSDNLIIQGWFDEDLIAAVTGAISGTSATTDGADTQSASGSVTGGAITGSAATTDGADTQSASGTISASATQATTDGADSQSASGTLSATGTSATTDGADTQSASGTVGNVASGSIAVTDGADTSSASGDVSASASSATTDGADSHSASGSISASATSDTTDGADVITASGAVFTTASSATTDGADTQTADGSVSNDVVGVSSVLDGGDIFIATGDVSGSRGGFYHGELRDFARKTLTKRQIAEQRKALGILADYPQQAAAEIVKGLMDPDVSSNDLDMMQAEIAAQAARLSKLMGLVIEHRQIMAALDLQIRVRRDEEMAMLAVLAAYQYQ